MSSSKNRIPIQGSERVALPGAHITSAVDPHERILVTVVVRRKRSSKELSSLVKEIGAHKLNERKHLSRDEFATTYGADPTDLAKIKEFAHEYGLDIVEVKPTQRRVMLRGTAAALSAAFGVYLAHYEHPTGSYRGRTGPLHVPEDIAPIVEGVFGLDNRPQVHPHVRILGEEEAKSRAEAGSYTPPQIAQLYNFPTGLDGTGQCIAILEFGGGYDSNDFQNYFKQLGISEPKITWLPVDGGSNQFTGDPKSPDTEVALDVEVAGAIAPGAQIVVYFAPNTDQGFIDAISAAIHDTNNKPSVISISWAGAEICWTQQNWQGVDRALQEAAALGVTVCCSSGDHGSTDGKQDGLLHVEFPGSSPYLLCCGGTKLEGQGSTIANETVWNGGCTNSDGSPAPCGTGGGVSDLFDLPTYQANANVPPSANRDGRIGRGVPDVAGDADPFTGYQILMGGRPITEGGTSAVAPLWAGLIALFNQKLGNPVGFLNQVLYSLPPNANAFHGITIGDNDITGNHGPYHAGAGWDACTGLGTPDGTKLLQALITPPTSFPPIAPP
jgi:kumamolisin